VSLVNVIVPPADNAGQDHAPAVVVARHPDGTVDVHAWTATGSKDIRGATVFATKSEALERCREHFKNLPTRKDPHTGYEYAALTGVPWTLGDVGRWHGLVFETDDTPEVELDAEPVDELAAARAELERTRAELAALRG